MREKQGRGMIFSHDADKSEQKIGEADTNTDIETTRSRPHLKVVK